MDHLTPEFAFEQLKTNTLDAIKSYFPHEGRHNTLVVEDLHVDDKLHTDDVSSQAEVKDKDGTWGVPVKGTLKLVNKHTGKVVDEKKGAIIARLPKLTNRYSYIVGGNEYQVDHLFRLKSGVYARVQDNGDLESEFNLAESPTGRGFSLKLDAKDKKFSMKYGESHIPLYPVLKSMGVGDDELEKSWGKEIFAANKPANEKKFHAALATFAKRVNDTADARNKTVDQLHDEVRSFFSQAKVRPDTTKITLGEPHEEVTGKTLFQAAHKLLGVSRGTQDLDDRDSLAFKEVAGAEDFIKERILRGARRGIKGRLRSSIDVKKSVGEIVSPDLFNRPIHDFFLKGGSISERSDQTNPLQMLSAHRKTTLMSRDFGGIKSEQSLTQEMRSVNQSHFGFLDPMHTPESEKAGITLHLAANVRKNGPNVEIPVFDLKQGKATWVKADDFHLSMAVLPDQVTWKDGKPTPIAPDVKVKLSGGNIEHRKFSEARYVLPSARGMFNYASNLIPFLSSDNGNRVMMADKQMEQAIGLKHREVPLVQTRTDHPDEGHTFDKLIGHFIATTSPVAGKVVAVTEHGVKVQGADGKKHDVPIYNNFPLNDAKGMLHSEPIVKVGDTVKKGQVVADNNYTKKGTLAIGTNLRVGYLPYKGYNFEDGIVISESAAKKLTSDHLYKKHLEIDTDRDVISKEKLKHWGVVRSQGQMTPEHWNALDDTGVVKVGTKVSHGQVLVAAIGKNDARKQSFFSSYGNKRAFQPFRDKSLVWDEDHEGVVTKVVRDPSGKGVRVYVRTEESAVVGDKLAGRHGNKGIITQIIPDAKMPFTKDAKTGETRHIEVALNPSGVPTRINPGQILETAAAKIAEKTGKPYVVKNFDSSVKYNEELEKELAKHGITDEEHVYDPDDTRKPLGSVLVGPQYLLKLKHQVEKKLTARGAGTDVQGKRLPIDLDKQPTKGAPRGGQGFGALELYSLLGHDARHNIREMSTYKSDQQDQVFWSMIQTGHEPPPPKVPFTYEKFAGLLQGLGVNVKKEGTAVRIHPMTNKEILTLAGNGKHEIKDGSKTLRSKDLKEVPGGLFDPHTTGGVHGDKWAYIRLPEPVPNPIFVGSGNKVGPVPVLLGLKMKEFEDIMHGRKELHGLKGGKAIEEALKKVDVNKEIEVLRKELPKLTGADLDRANKKLKYLLPLKERGMKPHDAYVLKYVPVVPPKFRPVSPTEGGDVNYSPLNGHYKNIALITDEMKNFDRKTFTEEHLQPLRSQLWDALKGLQSVGSHRKVYDVDSSGNRELKGILEIVGHGPGEQPKEGYFQSKLIKRRQNLSIRSTIIPEPALGIDEVGLPRDAAMEMYKPFVVAQLNRWGYPPLKGQDEIKKGTEIAKRALQKVVEERPILLKRDPALHKFNVMAFKPTLIDGKAIQIHPLVTGGYNADFDGDTMGGTIPVSHEAVEEAKKLFPSNNLFSPTNYGVMYLPGHEALLGIHLLSQWGKDTKKTFASTEALQAAVDKGEMHVTDVVHLKGAKGPTTLGRILIAKQMPKGYDKINDILHAPAFEITKKSLRELALPIAKKHTADFPKVVDNLKDLGNSWSFKLGFSFGLKDLRTIPERDHIIAEAEKKISSIKTPKGEARDEETIKIWQDATEKLEHAARRLPKQGNRLAQMVYSGARGDKDQLRQMIAAPMLVEGSDGKVIPNAIKRSFSEGLDVGEFWMSQHGARKGILQKNRGTAEPGAITKDIINASMSTLIVSPDCKTKEGVFMSLDNEDVHDRFLAAPYKLKDGTTLKAGEVLSPEAISKLRAAKHDKVLVRSPMKCAHGNGMCAKCFGLAEHGRLHDLGTNIGILASQAMGEPSTQLSMNSFHSGGVAKGAGAKSIDAITRLRNLLEMPQKIRDEATVATTSGPITAIKKDSAGGVDVFVGNARHYVPRHLVNEDLQVGHKVSAGDKLSHGHINPHALLGATKDIHAVQNFLASELHDGLFKSLGVRRRNIEVAVRNITNLAKVKDPGDSDWLHGDVVPRTVIEEHNRSLPKGHKPVQYDSVLKGTEQIPHLITKDWMQRLNYRELHTTIQQAAATGAKSELHGLSPIPGVAYGAEFGKPPAEVKAKKPYVY